LGNVGRSVCEQCADVSLVLEVVVGGAMVDEEGREREGDADVLIEG